MNYQIVNLSPLHSGGNGDLFLGQQTDSGELVVVKYLRENTPHGRRVFAREVRILSQKRNNVITILFARLDANPPYYVMPYFPAGSLTKWAGKLTEPQLLTIAYDLATAVHGLHAAWICHGDVKPDNTLLGVDGHLRIGDPLGNGLGCTVLFSHNHGGTPGYWAPEVRDGKPISQPADVHSFGATLYHLFTGMRPEDDQRLDLLVESASGSPKIKEIVTACCHPDPAERPKIREVLRMLRGETWAGIQKERQESRDAWAAVGIAAGVLVGVGLITELATGSA